jgi:hypothetical protein
MASVACGTLANGQAPACAVPPSGHVVSGTISATLRPGGRNVVPIGYAAALLEAIGEQYPTGEPLTLGAYTAADTVAAAAAYAAVAFTVRDSSTIDGLHMVASSLSPGFDRSILAAVRAAALPAMPKSMGRHVAFQLEVQTASEPDTEVDEGDRVGAVHMRWVTTAIPTWSHATSAGLGREQQWVPYPENARRARVEDSVLVQFVVGADGRIVPGTAMLLHATYQDFVRSISDRLSTFRFTPTTISGCPVPSVVRQAFKFQMAN